MNIEHRSDGYYIVTEEKTDKNQSIVIKLNSELDNQLISYSSNNTTTDITLSWKLKHKDKEGLYIELTADNRLKISKETTKIDNDICINELVNMVKNNGTLEDCNEIQKAICESYNKLFYNFLEEDKILHSNIIVNGIVEVKNANKILGHGTRFIMNRDNFIVCEYAGKTISSCLPQLNVFINNKKIICETIQYLYDDSNYFKAENSIGYLNYIILAPNVSCNAEKKNIEFEKLNTPYFYTDAENMIQYCKNNNTIEEIIKYKIALKGKTEILNIDEYMVNEFLI